jgi:hypothetical protein
MSVHAAYRRSSTRPVAAGTDMDGSVWPMGEEPPVHLRPFVLPTPDVACERTGRVDLYLPEADQPRPAVVFVHGGPEPVRRRPTPREWPVFRGYGANVAARGLVGATVDHRFYSIEHLPTAADDVAEAIHLVRTDPRVDADRIGLWFFSAGGLLLADWLRVRPAWLRVVAATYPILGAPPESGVDARFDAGRAVSAAGELPIVLTRVGLERPMIAGTVETFVGAASDCGANLHVIDVPDGHHAFDMRDHTDQSRAAVAAALTAVERNLW